MTATRELRLLPYERVSRVGNRGERLISPELQRRENERYAASYGHKLVFDDDGMPFSDLNMSGRTSEKRQIKRMIDKVRRGEADGVLVSKIDRWGRSLSDALLNIVALRAAGGEIHSATENLQALETPNGQFQLNMLLIQATYMSDNISAGWKQAHSYRTDGGRTAHGTHRFGYVMNTDRLHVPDWMDGTEELREGESYQGSAAVLRDAYEQFVRGTTMHSLVKQFEAAGRTTSRGNKWVASTLRAAMDSGFAAGLIATNKKKGPAGPEDRNYTEGKHEAIITMDLWERYVALRSERRAPRTVAANYALSNLVWCGGCGTKCMARGGGPAGAQYRVMACRSTNPGFPNPVQCDARAHIREEVLLQHLRLWLHEHAEDTDTRGRNHLKIAEQQRKKVSDAVQTLADIEQEIAGLEKAYSLAADNALELQIGDLSGIKLKLQAYEDKLTFLRNRKALALRAREINGLEIHEQAAAVERAMAADIDRSALNVALHSVIDSIVVTRDPEHSRTPIIKVNATWEVFEPGLENWREELAAIAA